MSLLERVQKKNLNEPETSTRPALANLPGSTQLPPAAPGENGGAAADRTGIIPAEKSVVKTASPGIQAGIPSPAASPLSSLSTGGQFGKAASKQTKEQAQFTKLKSKVHARLVDEMQDEEGADREVIVEKIQEIVNAILLETAVPVPRNERNRIVESLINDVLGLGPLESLLNDLEVSEIMINGYNQIYVEEKGKLKLSTVEFDSNKQLLQVIDRVVSSVGRRVDESSPMCDARLQDGSRVNVIIPPLALNGPTMTIRKFAAERLGISDLIKYKSLTSEMGEFLRACVRARLNVLVSGGTGSGKTTTLNIISNFIPEDERIITVEDAAELQLQQDHVITLESRPANVEGRGRITIRDLVVNCLRMRPDRIVVGECRGGEALDMLQAMNTGHDGSLTTIHANSAEDCMNRLETLVLLSGAELPSRAIREQIASAIQIVIQQARLRDGTRKVISISEITGIENERVKVEDIFIFKQKGVDDEGKVKGYFTATGNMPRCLVPLTEAGESLPITLFEKSKDPYDEDDD